MHWLNKAYLLAVERFLNGPGTSVERLFFRLVMSGYTFSLNSAPQEGKIVKKLVFVLLGLVLSFNFAFARDWFVSAERGRGKKGTIEEPAGDLGNIISRLENGDRIFIAAGVYTGRGGNGHDNIDLAVEIYGGFSDDFSMRDPWGAYKTIFSGENPSQNFSTQARLAIDASEVGTKLMEARGQETAHKVVVDGIIINNADRNHYADPNNPVLMKRPAGNGFAPTPESGGLIVSTGINSEIIVNNVVVINTAPTVGAFTFFPGRDAVVTVTNNAAINNTGVGFHLSKSQLGSNESDYPHYTFENNISIFNEKHDPIATYGGSSVMVEGGTLVEMRYNVFAMNDYYAIDNASRNYTLIATDNLIFGNAIADYLEFSTKMSVYDMEDWADWVEEAWDNDIEPVSFGISDGWLTSYFAREVIDRAAAEQDVQVIDSWQNDMRAAFGLNLQGTDLNVDSDVWLPRLELEDAFNAIGIYRDSYGTYYPEAAASGF